MAAAAVAYVDTFKFTFNGTYQVIYIYSKHQFIKLKLFIHTLFQIFHPIVPLYSGIQRPTYIFIQCFLVFCSARMLATMELTFALTITAQNCVFWLHIHEQKDREIMTEREREKDSVQRSIANKKALLDVGVCILYSFTWFQLSHSFYLLHLFLAKIISNKIQYFFYILNMKCVLFR